MPYPLNSYVFKTSTEVRDSTAIPAGTRGKVHEYSNYRDQYFVFWTMPDGIEKRWWVHASCLSQDREYTLKAVLAKIKYLDKRYAERKHAANVRL